MIRVVALVVGVAFTLLIWPIEDIDYSYNVSIFVLLVSLFASLLLEVGLRKLSTPVTLLKILSRTIIGGIAFGLLYLALVVLVAFVANLISGDIGMRLGNTMSQIRFFTPSAAFLAMCVLFGHAFVVNKSSSLDPE